MQSTLPLSHPRPYGDVVPALLCRCEGHIYQRRESPRPPHPACIGYDDEAAMPTEEGTFILCLPAHLSLIRSGGDYELSANYVLGNNLNLNNEPFTPIGTFTGSFDGQNRKIQNLKIRVATTQVGLFEELDTGGLIQNLALEEVET